MSCEKGEGLQKGERRSWNDGSNVEKAFFLVWCDMYKKVLTVWRVQDGLFRDGCVLGKKTDLKIEKYATGIGNMCIKWKKDDKYLPGWF